MIKTIFYFVPSETEYRTMLELGEISSRTITFVGDSLEIYVGSTSYGKSGLLPISVFNEWKDGIDTSISSLRNQTSGDLSNAITQINSDIDALRDELEQSALDLVDSATNRDGKNIWLEIDTTNNNITAITGRLDTFSDENGLKQSIIESAVESGLNSSETFTDIKNKWVLADENDDIVNWAISGYKSQVDFSDPNHPVSLAAMYASQNTELTNRIAEVETLVNDDSVIASLIAQTNSATNTAVASISAEVTSEGISNARISADNIILEGTTFANKLFANAARISDFSIDKTTVDNTAVSSIYSNNANGRIDIINNKEVEVDEDSTIYLPAVWLLRYRRKMVGKNNEDDNSPIYNPTPVFLTDELEISPIGIKTITQDYDTYFQSYVTNVTNQINTDGSGSIASGNIRWDSEGNIEMEPNVAQVLAEGLSSFLRTEFLNTEFYFSQGDTNRTTISGNGILAEGGNADDNVGISYDSVILNSSASDDLYTLCTAGEVKTSNDTGTSIMSGNTITTDTITSTTSKSNSYKVKNSNAPAIPTASNPDYWTGLTTTVDIPQDSTTTIRLHFVGGILVNTSLLQQATPATRE